MVRVSVIISIIFFLFPINGMAGGDYKEKYQNLLMEIESGGVEQVRILYMDPSIMARSPITPDILSIMACRFSLNRESEWWEVLLKTMKSEPPGIRRREQNTADLRMKIIFIGSKGESELLLGAYFGEGADGIKKYGKIDGEPIFLVMYFTVKLKK